MFVHGHRKHTGVSFPQSKMSEIPRNMRRRHSTDTISTIDMPAPPYGLVDAAQRPGSILNVPAPLVRDQYRLRVGKLEIACMNPWRSRRSEFQLLEVAPIYQHLSPELTAIIANLEAAIRLGLILSNLLEFYYYNDSSAEIIQLYNRLSALWDLCVSVGAASCEYDVILPGKSIKDFSDTVSWICDYLLKRVAGRAQRLGLLGGTDAMPEELPGPKIGQKKTVERFANEANKECGPGMDRMSQNLGYFNMRFQMKRIEN